MKRGNGEGTISKRKEGGWWGRLSVHTPEGRKRKAFYGKTRKEVAEKMAAYSGDPAPRRKLTVSEWVEEWLVSCKRTVAPSTFTRYKSAVNNYVLPHLGGIRLQNLTSGTLEDWRDDLLQDLAPETAKHALGTLSTALGRAQSRGVIASNPASTVKRPRTPKKMRPLSETQVARLMREVKDTRYEAFYRVAATLGLRHGELLALFWSDFDEEAGVLNVERSVDTRGKPVWGRTKTGEERHILLSTPTLECLKRHRKIQAEEKLAARTWEDERLIFPNQRGGLHRRNSVRVIYKRHLKRCELPDIRFHDLRHTAATLMLTVGGVDVVAASQILGHKNPTQTLNRYAHVLVDAQRMAADRMANYSF